MSTVLRGAALLLAAALLVACPGVPEEACDAGSCDGSTGACLEDLDCRGGEVCEQGVCVPVNGVCESDADCDRGERCELLTGECVPAELCERDADCPSGQLCRVATGDCIDDPGCTRDVECSPPARVCEGGACVDGCGTAGCTGTNECNRSTGRCAPAGGCSDDPDCDPPQTLCVSGACVQGCRAAGCQSGWSCNMGTGRCEQVTSCTADADCSPPSTICHLGTCIDGCTPGGCGDGYVCNTTVGRCESGAGGTTCVTDSNCSPPVTVCQGGSCVAGCTAASCGGTEECSPVTGRCQPIGGGGCISDADCSAPFPTCSGGTCVGSGGGDCTTAGCGAGQLCDPYLGQCEAQGTTPLGANCTRHEDCVDDYCLVLGDGQGRCTRSCSATQQCPDDFNCYAIPPPGTSFCIHESLIGKDYGPDDQGAACSDTVNQCQSGICLVLTGTCTDTCQHDRDCVIGSDACTLLIGDFDGDFVDELRTICFPRGFGGTTGDYCTANSECMRGNCIATPPGGTCADPCCTSTDCPTGFACQVVQRAGAVGIMRACGAAPYTGNAPVGSPCSRADHTPCRSGWCFEDPTGAPPYCTDTCCNDGDCPGGFRCISELFDVDGDGVDDVSQPLCQRR